MLLVRAQRGGGIDRVTLDLPSGTHASCFEGNKGCTEAGVTALARKSIFRRVANRVLNLMARMSPGATSLRPFLHRLRGVRIGKGVFIGDDVYVDAEYPEMIEIHDRAAVSMRATIVAHNKGPGRVIIEKEAFVGPHVVVMCSSGKVLRIGEGAVISAGCVVSRNVPPRVVVVPAATEIVGEATVSLAVADTIEEFWAGLRPITRKGQGRGRIPDSSQKPASANG